ncbi:MAG: DUF4136 domain-containing protein [Cyclobacteriaceae bacterium]
MKWFAIGLIIVLAAGCSPVRILTTDKFPENFTRYETFNFYRVNVPGESPYLEDLKNAIISRFQSRGYRLDDNADILINIGTNVEEKIQTRETDYRDIRYMGQRNYSWESEEVIVNQYREGTAVIDIVDSRTDQLIWQGVAAGTVVGNEQKMQKRIEKGIDLLFKDLPQR